MYLVDAARCYLYEAVAGCQTTMISRKRTVKPLRVCLEKISLVTVVPSHPCNNLMSEYHVRSWWTQFWQEYQHSLIGLLHELHGITVIRDTSSDHYSITLVIWYNCYKSDFLPRLNWIIRYKREAKIAVRKIWRGLDGFELKCCGTTDVKFQSLNV